MGPPGLDDGRGENSFLHKYGVVLRTSTQSRNYSKNVLKLFLHKYKTVLSTSCNALHSIEKELRSPLCKDPPSAIVVVVVAVVFVVRWLLAVGCCCGW